MMEKIKPCPFCGSDSAYCREAFGTYPIVCGECGATGPEGSSEADAILLWNAAANALAVKDKTISKLNSALIECEAALADTEEDRHEAVSKLSLALIREAALKEGDKKDAEIDKLSDERDYWLKAWQYNHEYWQREYKNETGRKANAIAERDEARKVARHYYRKYTKLKDAVLEIVSIVPNSGRK